jgi:hypothetical protein
LARQITEPGEAEETADWAVETLLAVVVHSAGGGGGGEEAVTVQLRTAGVTSTFPAASVARTEKLCDLTPRPE